MTATLIMILMLTVAGLPAALSLDRKLAGGELLGVALLLGCGEGAFALLALSLLSISWSIASWSIAMLIVFVILSIVAARARAASADAAKAGFSIVELPIDLVALMVLAGYAVYATAAPMPHWDFWAIWGLKGKVFAIHQGVDWAFLRDRDHLFAHPDYPLLLPLILDVSALFHHAWEDREAGLLFVAFGVALLLLARDVARREISSPVLVSLAVLGLVPAALSTWVGLAEGPLVAFTGAGLLLLRGGLRDDDDARIRAGAVLLGLGAFTKNEGIAFLASTAIAVVLVTWRSRRHAIAKLWPALAVAAPWLIIRAFLDLPTDLFTGSLASRIASRLGDPMTVIRPLVQHPPDRPFYWLALVVGVALLFVFRRAAQESFLLIAIGIQLAFYLGSYVVTVNDVGWHVATSWSRLLDQIAFPLTFVVLVPLLGLVDEMSAPAAAEDVRSEHA